MVSRPFTKYHYSTDNLLSRFKPALTNTFDVFVNSAGLQLQWGSVPPFGYDTISFMAYEAVLPGTSYELGSVYGQRQGRTEYYPTRRVYPPVDVSFYVDKDYNVLKFFEVWMNTISKNEGSIDNSYVNHLYPDTFQCDITIAKFERDFYSRAQRLPAKPNSFAPRPGSVIKYTLRDAFPSNLISVPVSYEGASILKTTVTFQYSVYNFAPLGDPTGNQSSVSDDQSDASVPGQIDPGDVPNFLGNTPNELAALQREAFQKSIRASGKSGSQFKSEAAQQIINQDVYKGLNLDQK